MFNINAIAAEYVNLVGYNPFEDCPSITVEEVIETLDGVWELELEAAAQAVVEGWGTEARVEEIMIAQSNAFAARYN